MRYVLNASAETPCFHEQNDELSYLHLSTLRDSVDANVSQHFDAALAFIDSALNANEAVLVHCKQGVSRSVTLLLAHLVARRRSSLRDAVELVRSKSPSMGPNESFFRALQRLEVSQLGVEQPSLSLRDYLAPRLVRLGFSRNDANEALQKNGNHLEKAAMMLRKRKTD